MRNTMNTLTSTTLLASTRTTAVGSLCSLSMGMTVGMRWCRQITLSKGEDLI